jgi:hypothetical protein
MSEWNNESIELTAELLLEMAEKLKPPPPPFGPKGSVVCVPESVWLDLVPDGNDKVVAELQPWGYVLVRSPDCDKFYVTPPPDDEPPWEPPMMLEPWMLLSDLPNADTGD